MPKTALAFLLTAVARGWMVYWIPVSQWRYRICVDDTNPLATSIADPFLHWLLRENRFVPTMSVKKLALFGFENSINLLGGAADFAI